MIQFKSCKKIINKTKAFFLKVKRDSDHGSYSDHSIDSIEISRCAGCH